MPIYSACNEINRCQVQKFQNLKKETKAIMIYK